MSPIVVIGARVVIVVAVVIPRADAELDAGALEIDLRHRRRRRSDRHRADEGEGGQSSRQVPSHGSPLFSWLALNSTLPHAAGMHVGSTCGLADSSAARGNPVEDELNGFDGTAPPYRLRYLHAG